MVQLLKRLASRLPSRYQQELKRFHFARQIAKGIFTTAEEMDAEYARLHLWVGRGDWVLDLGANVGNYTARLSELVGPGGRVIAIEPVPETFELLTSNLARFPFRNVTLLNAAASDRAGIAGMTMPTLDSGLENRYMAHLTETGGGLDVLCLSIDSLALPHCIRLVKIDVEGHELSALRGMQALIARDRPVLVIEGRSHEVADFLKPFGYTYEDVPSSPNRLFKATPA